MLKNWTLFFMISDRTRYRFSANRPTHVLKYFCTFWHRDHLWIPNFWLFQGPILLKIPIFEIFFPLSAKTDVLPLLNGTIFLNQVKVSRILQYTEKNRTNNFFSENENSQISFEKSRQKWKTLPKRLKIVNFSTYVPKFFKSLQRIPPIFVF